MNKRDRSTDKEEKSALAQLLESDNEFFRTVSGNMIRIAAGMGLPPAEIERVVAEAWLKAVEHSYLFEGDAIRQRLRSWLLKVVHGKSVDALRRLSHHPCESLDTREDELIDEAEAKRVEIAELRERLEMLLKKASLGNEDNVRLFRAHFFEGVSIQELALLHGMTAKSVESRIRRLKIRTRELATELDLLEAKIPSRSHALRENERRFVSASQH